ncbi:MAG: PLP-dependent aminotransferase family protein [Lachnospiraceae bacterium]
MNELAIPIDLESKTPLYEQIYQYIKDEILAKALEEGDKIPSSRVLASHLRISRSTINIAYEQLIAEGYIESKPGIGYFVCKVEELYHIQVENKKKIDTIKKKEDNSINYNFTANGIDLRQFPYKIWSKITKEILSEGKNELLFHGEPRGEEELLETIRKYLYVSRGVKCTTNQIVVGAGNDYLLMLLHFILKKEKKDIRIAFEETSYMKAKNIFEALGSEISYIDLDSSGIITKSLELSDADIVYTMPSHQFPTGIIMPIGRRRELLGWALKQEGRYIIEDDYDSEFRYKGKPIPSLKSIDMEGKVIYIGTFSRAIAPTIRISYMVLPLPLLERYNMYETVFASTVSKIDQRILNEFINCGAFEKHLNRMRKVYKVKHDLMLECLQKFRKKFIIKGEHAGVHLLMTARDGTSERILIQKAKEKGVKIVGLSSFSTKNEEQSTVIIGYGKIEEEEIVKGIKALESAWL